MSDLLAFFIKIVPSAFFAGLFYLYSNKRDYINKHPDSVVFKLFEWIDNIIVTKIEKEKSKPINSGGFITNLHKYVEYDSLYNISDAKVVTFDLSKNIPKKELLFFSTIIPLLIFSLITLSPVIYLLFSAIEQTTKELFLAFIVLIYVLSLVVFFSGIYGQRLGILGQMVSLYKDDGVEITITQKMVYLSTYALGNRVIKIDWIKEFGVKEKNHALGLYYSDQKDRISWVIQFPKIYSNKILTLQELQSLSDKLNEILLSYKSKN